MPQRSPGRGRGESVRPLYADPAPPVSARRQPANPGLAPKPNRPAQGQEPVAPHLGRPGGSTTARPVPNPQPQQTENYQTASHAAAASHARTPQKVISLAQQLGIPVEPLVLAVLFGCNLCYATPVAYQTNMLIMSAGEYKFGDYTRTGVPLVALMIVTLSALLVYRYGLH